MTSSTKNPLEESTADELLSLGERQLLEGDISQALSTFSEVDSLIQDTEPTFSLRQALALFEYGSDTENKEALALANKKFKKSHHLSPESTEILEAWGCSLTKLAELEEKPHLFLEAKEKYERALGLGEESADLYWNYAISWFHLGLHAEEAYDLKQALKYFAEAHTFSPTLPAEFWIDYGATALQLSRKIPDLRFITKAIHCFRLAIDDEESLDGWLSLADALQALHDHTSDEEHLEQALECYEAASKLTCGDGMLFHDWAKLLCKAGDEQSLRQAIEKCMHAYAYDPENPLILATWAEALAQLGKITDTLDLIHEAENKITEALLIDENLPEVWHGLGLCFQAFASYFHDLDLYYQAIEKFQEGLSIDRTRHELWLEMARTFFIIGDLENNEQTVHQSLKFFKKALALCPNKSLYGDYAMALAKIGEILHEEEWLDRAIAHFEYAIGGPTFSVQPDWLFSYGSTLDMLGDFHEEESYYLRAIELLTHVLMIDPKYPKVQHRLAQAFCHLGELTSEVEHFYRAIHHLRLARKQEEECDNILLDWGIALINIAQHTPNFLEVEQVMQDAMRKLTKAANLGNIHSYYHLSCLYSLLDDVEKAIIYLHKAEQFAALPPLEEMLADDWLETLRNTSQFHEFLAERPNLR